MQERLTVPRLYTAPDTGRDCGGIYLDGPLPSSALSLAVFTWGRVKAAGLGTKYPILSVLRSTSCWYFAQHPVGHIVQELCESQGGRPELSILTSLLVSVDVKNY